MPESQVPVVVTRGEVPDKGVLDAWAADESETAWSADWELPEPQHA